jgi:hypothetical protein
LEVVGLWRFAIRIPKSEFRLATAFADLSTLPTGRQQAGEDNLDGFQEDADFQKEGHKTD